MRTTRVLVLGAGSSVPVVGSPQDGVVFHQCIDLADLAGRAAAGAADVAALSPRAAGVDAATVDRLRGTGCRPVAVLDDPADADLAARIGLTESLVPPLRPSAVASIGLDRTAAALPAEPLPEGRNGSVVAVWGPPGSPGRSTAAALLALGAQRSGLRAVLVDMDLAAPQWGLFTPEPTVGSPLALAFRRAAMGITDIADLVVQVQPGLGLLPAACDPTRWAEFDPGATDAVVAAVAATHDVVVIDAGFDVRAPHPAYDVGWAHDSGAVTRQAMRAADATVAVLSAEPAGVHRFASWLPVLREASAPSLVVANRVGHPRGGRRADQQVARVLASVGLPVPTVSVPWEPQAADRLAGPDWARAKGWRNVPEQLWAACAPAEVSAGP